MTQSSTSRSLIPADWQLPETIRQRLGTGVGRQRLMHADGHLLLVLHRPPEAQERGRRGRFLWRDNEGRWHGSDTGNGPQAVRQHLDEYQDALERFEQLESQAQFADQYMELVEGLAPLMRASRNQHAVFQQAREQSPGDRELIDFRDAAYEIERSADLLYDEAKNGMDVAIVRRSEEQAAHSAKLARTAHRMNLLAAFFFPLATISSMFGSGLTHGWEERSAPLPFFIMIGGSLMAGIALFMTVRKS